MNNANKPFWNLLILMIGVVYSCEPVEEKNSSINSSINSKYPNTLNISGVPSQSKDCSVYSFSDLGAWHSYSLNPRPSGGFVGPYLMTDDNGLWSSQQLVTLNVSVDGNNMDWASARLIRSEYWPGRLVQEYQLENCTILQQLIFISDRSTLVQYEVSSKKSQTQINTTFEANSWLSGWNFSVQNSQLLLKSDSSQTQIVIAFDSAVDGKIENGSFSGQKNETSLESNSPVTINYIQSAYFSNEEKNEDQKIVESVMANPEWAFANNTKRWDNYIKRTLTRRDAKAIDSIYQRVAIKSLNTLINNWRSVAGELKHDGLFPSYAYGGFHGFWAWDSWKHAVGLADIVPELAKEQILTMYDYQDMDGMIADCIFRDTLIEKHNWRDTKPPLSGWAITKVFDVTQDTAFVRELFPKLKKYHQWWYDFRDHDGNGICEYGSTDGTRVAAAWESGMDNAVRFDEATMLTNAGGGYSLDQESVDLNAYLYAEKIYLASLAMILGKNEEALKFNQEASALGTLIREKFYNSEEGFYFDVMLDNKMINIFGPEGWIPLWAEVASKEQAKAIVERIMDESKFNTKVPLPTLDASHDKFNPKNGYWRGPVWLDQVYFAIRGLEKYGYQEEAEILKKKLFANAEGLLSDGPIRENYHPISGEGLNAMHFSWSAAHLLMLIRE